jgi:hypothetical protein
MTYKIITILCLLGVTAFASQDDSHKSFTADLIDKLKSFELNWGPKQMIDNFF